MIAFSRRWLRRGVDYVFLPLALLFVALVLLLRLWILPDIDRWRDDIAASISHSAGQRVTLGEINANWQGLHPHLRIRDIRVFGADGRPALFLADVRAVLSWTSLLHGELRLASLTMDDVALTIRRDMQGIHVAGILLNQSGSSGGFGDWLLAQRNIQVNHATLAWDDERRGAPYLVARDVNLTLQNRGHRHRFRLTAIPPEQLAQPIDIRGDFNGRSLDDLASWHGQIYARVDRTDLGQWRQWLTLPYAISQGYGGLRVWLDVASRQVIAATVDASLRQVSVQFAPNLPALKLANISGRTIWKRLGLAQSFAVKQMSLRTTNFVYVAPFDLTLRLDPGKANLPGGGRIDTNNAQLDRLAALAPYLPLDATQHQRLTDLQPRGQLEKFTLAWRGSADHMPLDYQVKGRFTRLGWQAQGGLPGAAGLSGNVDATRSNGTLSINSSNVMLALPRVLPVADVALATLTAQMNWREQKQGYLFKLTEASFANTDLSGSAFGDYQYQSGQRGNIDLTARLGRLDARQVYRYLPVTVNEHTDQWLQTALLGGQARDMSVRLKGDLAHFPFRGGRDGLFEVAARVENGVLQYAPDWPRIEGIQANLLFRGERMEITSNQANIYGVALSRVSAIVPDLFNGNPMLEVNGEARGATDAFARFVNTSPVTKLIDGITNNMGATGNSRLRLNLKVPLHHAHDVSVAGDLAFDGNSLTPAGLPPLQNIRGRLQFTNTGIVAQNISVQMLGGPATISATSQPGGITHLVTQGRMSAAGLRPFLSPALASHLRGTADWHATINLRHLQAEADFESNLVGMASDLPSPFAKTAAESQPLRVKKTLRAAGESLLSIHYGQVASALLLQTLKNGQPVFERGALRFGGEAALPEESGLWITGSLPLSDLDRWRNQFSAAGTGAGGLPALAGVNLNFSTLDLFGHRFQNIGINARNQNGTWRANVAGQGVNGEVTWQPADRAGQPQGKLSAHFKTLTIPAALPAESVKSSQNGNLPALDINVDNLQLKNRSLGQLQVTATPHGSGLNFESIRLTHPDSTLTMQGIWNPDRIPQTQAKIHLEVNDVGKFLGRFDHPGLVKRGRATLDGEGEWNGTPADISIPSLSGTFALKASSGQFAKVDPGIGKLLGVLSLQALPRRIGLDFRDVFSDGFAFDEISGTMRLSRGVVYSDDFRMQGPSAKVRMSGMVDINAETQQLRVAVSPKLSESVALAGTLIGGPVVGLGALAVQKLLKDPFGQAATFEYSVTGAWSDPVVKRVGREASGGESSP